MYMHCKSALLATLAAIVLIFPTTIHASLPITGTFIAPDISYQSVAEYRQFFQELKDSGIDTVIFSLTGNLNKNCTTKQYIESNYLHTTFAGPGVACCQSRQSHRRLLQLARSLYSRD